MKRNLIFVVFTIALFALIGSVVWAQGDAGKGKELWAQRNCKNCHGENGEGGYAGPRAGDGSTVDVWISQVRTPKNRMPAYIAEQMSDADITDMWAYMQTLQKPASWDRVSYEAMADDPAGKVLMASNRCIACHGNFGEGLVNFAFVKAEREVTTEVIMTQVRTPRQNMPSFSAAQISDDEVGQIAGFMASVADRLKAALPETGGPALWTTVASVLSLSGLTLLGIGAGLRAWKRRH
jgi:ubiquinol-cytochrome c reductase cytochrome c subunit